MAPKESDLGLALLWPPLLIMTVSNDTCGMLVYVDSNLNNDIFLLFPTFSRYNLSLAHFEITHNAKCRCHNTEYTEAVVKSMHCS